MAFELNRFLNIFLSTWTLLVAGLVFARPMIHLRVKNHTELEDETLYVNIQLLLLFYITISAHGLVLTFSIICSMHLDDSGHILDAPRANPTNMNEKA